jgi:hypothetical protein
MGRSDRCGRKDSGSTCGARVDTAVVVFIATHCRRLTTEESHADDNNDKLLAHMMLTITSTDPREQWKLEQAATISLTTGLV